MPKCKNDPKRTYKGTEPSPKGLGHCAHTEKVGKKMKGKDGNQWIITQTKKGVKRWSKINGMKKEIKTIPVLDKYFNMFFEIKKNNPNLFNMKKTILDTSLNMKSISVEDEETIKNILSKNVKLKKEYDEKLIRKFYTLKKKKTKISVDKSITLYDKFSPDEKVKCKLDKGDYNIYVSNFIKFKNTFTTSMIVIEKDEKINMKDIKITKLKHSINISDSQEIVFEENNNQLYKFELEGMQFFGYNLPIYYGKVNGKIKMILIPVSQIYN